MLAKRIIPCLDVMNGRTVKGIHFENLRDSGDPVELAIRYSEQGADELVFLDIAATNEKRKTWRQLVYNIARHIHIPFTVGGGISEIRDVEALLNAGADKVSVNTSIFRNPQLIETLARQFGSQCIVAAIDTKPFDNSWYVHLNGGRVQTQTRALDWAREVSERGAGEILLTSMAGDGTRNGFSIDITQAIATSVPIPVIASGGAGTMEHFAEVFEQGRADAALAASVFHDGDIHLRDLKTYLKSRQIPIR
ncbi:MAG: imidazole glycerol phosphate synthase subunit HisF [Bacteroidetes bacterium]|nr:imidazole glycerol phosphate synthase subunit HisF [Bacteroidota bacterium]